MKTPQQVAARQHAWYVLNRARLGKKELVPPVSQTPAERKLSDLMYAQLRYVANPEKMDKQSKRQAAQYLANPEKAKAGARRAYQADPEKFKVRTAKYAKEHVMEMRAWRAKWKKAHPEQAAATAGIRRAVKRHALPPWVDRKAIRKIYAESREISKATGIVHHVDHIYPLMHKAFTGLHVPWNLQIITATENCVKHNSVTPSMLSMSFPL